MVYYNYTTGIGLIGWHPLATQVTRINPTLIVDASIYGVEEGGECGMPNLMRKVGKNLEC